MKKIKAKILSFIEKIPQPSNWKFWLGLALIVKTAFFIYLLKDKSTINEHYLETFALDGGDSISYIEPIENLLANGEYFDDHRMPGYGWLYFLLRLFMPLSLALNATVILQLILSSLSVYVLALCSIRLFKHNYYFYTTFILYCISTYVSLFETSLLTESFCTSALIFSFFFVLNEHKNKYFIFLSGLFLTWSFFLKPVLVPLIILFAAYVLLNISSPFKLTKLNWKKMLFFLIPFLLIDGSWIIRNYNKYERIIPLTKSIYYEGYNEGFELELFKFMQAFGGSIVHWNPGSEITFFKPAPSHIKRKIEVTFPENIYTSKFNYDSLLTLQKQTQKFQNNATSIEQKEILLNQIRSRLDTYTLSIKQERPFLYYVSSRFKIMKTFFLHSGTYNLFSKPSFELTKIEFLVKIFYSLLYLFVIVFGILGSFRMIIRKKINLTFLLISFTALYISLVFPIMLKLDEFRYLVPGYPFLLLSSIYMLHKTITIFNKKNG